MRDTGIDRRRFLAAVIAVGGVSMESLGPEGLRLSVAFAQTPDALSATETTALAQLARHLYPHASLPATVYTDALENALGMASADPALLAAFESSAAALDADRDFAELGQQAQIAAIRELEGSAAFMAILSAIRMQVYNHPAVWDLLGYEGASFQFGGYLGRGAGVVDWLEERD